MSRAKILVIEDNEMNLKLVKSLLQIGGQYEVIDAGDAESGLELARSNPPDLILMDIQLPGMDGLTATKQIKRDPELQAIPVVALTSYAMQGDEEKALAAGCIGYLTKPIDTRNFLAELDLYMENQVPRQDSVSVPDSAPPRAPRSVRRPRILIVDDEPMNTKLLAASLPKETYDVTCVYNGTECLQQVVETPPDLILLDVMMPGLDGYEVTTRLKTDTKTAHIPIILVTALDSPEDKANGLDAGADEFLSKPVNVTELRARINSMLRLRQYQEQLVIRTQSESHVIDAAPATEALERTTHRQRILIVEDNESDLKLLQHYLEGVSHEVEVVSDGKEAVARAKEGRFDLIMLDVMLPGLDGFEVCQRLKKQDETRDIQIIMITCLDDLESRIKGVEYGVDDYLVKPLHRRELKARVAALLKKKAYIDQLRSHYEMALSSAITDGLTGLYNHAYFARFLDLEIKRSLRHGHSTALILADIDNFKAVNDNHGHLVGDMILAEVGQAIKRSIREIDLAARYGGEEFAMVLPYADWEGAMTVAERVRKAIESHRFTEANLPTTTQVTISLGVAICPLEADGVKELIQAADAMLYQAKKAGKNRVCSGRDAGDSQATDPPPAPKAALG